MYKASKKLKYHQLFIPKIADKNEDECDYGFVIITKQDYDDNKVEIKNTNK